METTPPQPDTVVIRAHEREYNDDQDDEYDENGPVPDLEKDDMMARRTRSLHKPSAARANQCFNQFLPVPGSAMHNSSTLFGISHLQPRPKPPHNTSERYLMWTYVLVLCRVTSSRWVLCISQLTNIPDHTFHSLQI